MGGREQEETVSARPEETVGRTIAKLLGIYEKTLQERFMVFHRSKLIDPHHTFEQAGIQDQDFITLNPKLRGGG
jgi:hypothetical protein